MDMICGCCGHKMKIVDKRIEYYLQITYECQYDGCPIYAGSKLRCSSTIDLGKIT